MRCLKPLKIPNPRYKNSDKDDRYIKIVEHEERIGHFGSDTDHIDQYLFVPCGKCANCNKTRASGWRLRLLAQLIESGDSSFITLTLSPKYYDVVCNEPRKYINRFIDRLRKKLGFKPKYFIISELGDTTKRFHFHGILFGVPPNLISQSELANVWKYGFVGDDFIGYGDVTTCNYITKYLVKPQDPDFKPTLCVSPGIGKSFLSCLKVSDFFNGADIDSRVSLFGRHFSIPPYFKNKILSEDIRAIALVNRLTRVIDIKQELTYDGITYTEPSQLLDCLDSVYEFTLKHGLSITQKNKIDSLKTFNPYDN